MKIKDSVALVTGANRGLGRAFAAALLAGGARKVYAAARDPASVTLAGVTPVKLDVTNAQQAAALARELGDVSLLINNAGILRGTGLLEAGSVEAARAEMETHFFGPLQLSQAFAPVLARNGGGAILNVLSVLSWISMPGVSTYCASKAAEWSLTNGLRNELRAQGPARGLHGHRHGPRRRRREVRARGRGAPGLRGAGVRRLRGAGRRDQPPGAPGPVGRAGGLRGELTPHDRGDWL